MDEFTLSILQKLENLQSQVTSLRSGQVSDHRHDGYDTSRVDFRSISSRVFPVHHTIAGTAAATAGNYGVFYIFPVPCVAVSMREVHQTAGSDAGAVTLTIEKLTGTQALDAGAVVLSSTLSLKATANTVQSGTLTTTLANRTFAVGDRIAMKDSGTLTAVANVTVVMEFIYLN